MQRNGKIVVVDAPEVLKDPFGLASRVDEDQCGVVRLDELVHFAQRIAR